MKKPDYSWQGRCVDAVLTAVSQDKRDFLVNATPGSGKTRMTTKLATLMFLSDMIDFVVIVVPTSTVRDHFCEDMADEGITLARITDGADFQRMLDEGIGRDVRGFCMTTGMLVAYQGKIAELLAPHRVLFVSDEAHHNGGELPWARAAIAVSEDAVLRLGLSGTPYRSDNHQIPFLRYEEGVGMPCFNFTFDDARSAGIITAINFRTVAGHVDVMVPLVSDEPIRFDYAELLDEASASQRLRFSLHLASPYLYALVEAADDELELVRQTQDNAAGIIFANTKRQAERIAHYLRDRRGRKVRLVIDDADGSEEVAAFNESDQHWIVQIRKVYEGANIPRLRVGVYATDWTTEGFFDQASKRLVRRIEGVDPDEMPALMFMPADPDLERIASGLGDVKRHILKDPKERDAYMPTDGFDADDNQSGRFEIVGGMGHVSAAIINGVTYSAEEVSAAEDYFAGVSEMRGQPSITKMAVYAMMKRTDKL